MRTGMLLLEILMPVMIILVIIMMAYAFRERGPYFDKLNWWQKLVFCAYHYTLALLSRGFYMGKKDSEWWYNYFNRSKA